MTPDVKAIKDESSEEKKGEFNTRENVEEEDVGGKKHEESSASCRVQHDLS